MHLGVVDGEAGQVRVEGDGECGQARVGADDGQQLVITLATCTYLGLLIRGCPTMTLSSELFIISIFLADILSYS